NLIVCVPLNAWGLRRREGAGLDATLGSVTTSSAKPILTGRAYVFAMALFGLVLAICAFIFGALSVSALDRSIRRWPDRSSDTRLDERIGAGRRPPCRNCIWQEPRTDEPRPYLDRCFASLVCNAAGVQ